MHDIFTNCVQAGEEARRGTFSLTLTVGNPSSYTGTFTENSGATYTVTETMASTTIPTDIECFRTDLDLVTNDDTFSFTGFYSYSKFFSIMYILFTIL